MEMAMNSPETICKHNQSGYCKYQAHCRKAHIMELCHKDKCDRITCLNRHPIVCKYYDNYGRCKFGDFCAYAHRNSFKAKDIDDKISEVKKAQEQEIVKLKHEILLLKTQVDDLRKAVENKSKLLNEKSRQFIPSSNDHINPSIISLKTIPANIHQVEHIPQLDGNHEEEECKQVPGSTFQCETCHTKFSNEEEWKLHDTAQFCCDDCGICYQTQVESDLHELQEHPDSHYAATYIPKSTKELFARSQSRT